MAVFHPMMLLWHRRPHACQNYLTWCNVWNGRWCYNLSCQKHTCVLQWRYYKKKHLRDWAHPIKRLCTHVCDVVSLITCLVGVDVDRIGIAAACMAAQTVRIGTTLLCHYSYALDSCTCSRTTNIYDAVILLPGSREYCGEYHIHFGERESVHYERIIRSHALDIISWRGYSMAGPIFPLPPVDDRKRNCSWARWLYVITLQHVYC